MSMIEDDLIGVQKLPRSGSGDVSRVLFVARKRPDQKWDGRLYKGKIHSGQSSTK